MTRPATAPMPSAPLRSSRPTQITVMMPRRVTLLVPMARRSTLLLVSPSGVELRHAGIEEAEVHDGHPEPDDQARARPRAPRAAAR